MSICNCGSHGPRDDKEDIKEGEKQEWDLNKDEEAQRGGLLIASLSNVKAEVRKRVEWW